MYLILNNNSVLSQRSLIIKYIKYYFENHIPISRIKHDQKKYDILYTSNSLRIPQRLSLFSSSFNAKACIHSMIYVITHCNKSMIVA